MYMYIRHLYVCALKLICFYAKGLRASESRFKCCHMIAKVAVEFFNKKF